MTTSVNRLGVPPPSPGSVTGSNILINLHSFNNLLAELKISMQTVS